MAPDLKNLCERIAAIVRAQGSPLCAKCVTGLLPHDDRADELDIRVGVVHLSLCPGFIASDTCNKCGRPEERRNPVLRETADGITALRL